MTDFEQYILELKEPIFTVRIGENKSYKEIKLYLDSNCVISNQGEKNNINTSLFNDYFGFVRSFSLPANIPNSQCTGSLFNLFASYNDSNGEK